MKPRIVPALLEDSFTGITNLILEVADFVPYVQIDMIDGVHAPAVTWPFTAEYPERELHRLDGLSVPFELDLMVHNPEQILPALLATRVSRCIIHLTATRMLSSCIQLVRDAGREVYIGVVIDDNLADLEPYLFHVDGIQCMGIRHIGAQGEPFDERVLDLINAVRQLRPEVPITVDGGVSSSSLPMLVEAEVTHFAVGSALFRGDPEENYATLMELVNPS